jgi:hypothetical protein
VAGRVISGNTIVSPLPNSATISFSGSGTCVPWFKYGVGGAVITGNSFSGGTQYIRTRGDYDNSQFDWASYWNDNTFDRAVAVGPNPPSDIREYSYAVYCGNMNHVRRIGAVIQDEIDHAVAGDTVLVKDGTYSENLTIPTPLTLQGAGAGSTIIRPAISGPDVCVGASICPGASNVVLVEASDVAIKGLTIDGDNPALTSGVVRGGADLDARNGIITNHALGTFNNLEVRDTEVKNIYLRGIYASSGGTFNIHNNKVANVQGDYASIGIFNFAGSWLIEDNEVDSANDAIASNWSQGTQYRRNKVTNSGSGIHTDNNESVGDLIEDNEVSDCAPNGYGIWSFVVSVSPGPVFTGNKVSNCDIGMAAFGERDAGNGVTFTGNEISGPGSFGAYITTEDLGFGPWPVTATLTKNVITDFAQGVAIVEAGGETASAVVNRAQRATPPGWIAAPQPPSTVPATGGEMDPVQARWARGIVSAARSTSSRG